MMDIDADSTMIECQNFDIKGTSIHHCLAQTYIHMLDSSKSNLFM